MKPCEHRALLQLLGINCTRQQHQPRKAIILDCSARMTIRLDVQVWNGAVMFSENFHAWPLETDRSMRSTCKSCQRKLARDAASIPSAAAMQARIPPGVSHAPGLAQACSRLSYKMSETVRETASPNLKPQIRLTNQRTLHVIGQVAQNHKSWPSERP